MNTVALKLNPFPGLRPFRTDERHLFFGREAQTVELLERLQNNRFLAAVGPSGSGKSSLVLAGLIPGLHGGMMAKAGSHWEVLVMRPGGDPLAQLAARICDARLNEAAVDDLPAFVQATLSRSALGLVKAVKNSTLAQGSNLLVVVDQFEEIFRFGQRGAAQRDAAEAFVQLLLEASRNETVPIYVVLTMRSDFIGDCAQFHGLAEAINAGSYLIPRLTRDQWRAAIEGPVKVEGGRLAPRLVQRLLNDAGDDPDQLPILQHALMRAWDYWAAHETADGPIDLAHYEGVGGMAEALSRHADETYDGLPDAGRRKLAEKLFRALAEKGSDNRGIRRPTRVSALMAMLEVGQEELRLVVDHFRRPGRTFLMPPHEVELKPGTVIDISHESLMRVWRRMNDWVDKEAQSSRIYRRLSQTALLWIDNKAGPYRPPDLDLALQWREANHPNPAWAEHYGGGYAEAIKFLDESRGEFEKERAEQEAARRRELDQARALAEAERLRAEERTRAARRMKLAAIVLALLALATAGFWRRAVNEKRQAYSRELAALALARLEVDPETSVLLARRAATESAAVLPVAEASDALRQSLFESRVRHKLRGHTHYVTSTRFSPDGRLILTASDDGTARLWNVEDGQLRHSLTNHTGPVKSAEFSPDGKFAVTAGVDGQAIVWNVATGAKASAFGHPNGLNHAAFSPDGRRVITAGDDSIARVWDIQTGGSKTLSDHAAGTKLYRSAFSPDGLRIVTAGEDETARIWDAQTHQRLAILTGHANHVIDASISPDGQWVVTASADGTARIWTAHGSLTNIIVHQKQVEAAAFSPDSQSVVTASADHTARVWHRRTGETVILVGHSGPVLDAAFSPDGRFVATASGDKTVRLWLASNGLLVATWRGHERQVQSVAFSASGQWIASASHDRTARIWESPVWRNSRLPLGAPELFSADLSRDGKLVATADKARRAQIWTAADGQVQSALTESGYVSGVAFGGSDIVALTTNNHGPVRIWNRRTKTLEASLPSTNKVNRAAFSADERWLAVARNDGATLVWDWRARNLLATLTEPAANSISCVAFSGDGRLLAVASTANHHAPGRLRIWQHAGNSFVAALPLGQTEVQSLALSRDGDQILLGGLDGSTKLWRWRAGVVREWPGHELSVNAAQFSPDGLFAVTASEDETVRIWSVETGRPLAVWRGHTSGVMAAAFAADHSVVTVGRDGAVITWSARECAEGRGLLGLADERMEVSSKAR